jgi:coenzyme F420-0:L-glutamate ligase/coenzyme F420-1:gamma-L-glutamate ligase
MPEVNPGDDLAALIAAAARSQGVDLGDGDIVIVAQKVVSKAEGRIRNLRSVRASRQAHRIADRMHHEDARFVQVVLDEAVRIVHADADLFVETRGGYICANAGVDRSNVPGTGIVALLPERCDESAERLRDGLARRTERQLGIIVTDSFSRHWRTGLTNVALGIAGVPALIDYRGQVDHAGKVLKGTMMAVADELAGAAELVMGKSSRVPVAIVRGYRPEVRAGRGLDLVATETHAGRRPRPKPPKPPTLE